MKQLRSAITVALLLSRFAVAAPQNDQHSPFVRGPASESRIAQEVRHQLVMLPYYTIFDDLALNVNGSVVTLLWDVTNPVLKSDAENVVKKIEGVTQVNNKINVLPLSPMDSQIRRAEFRAIYGDPQIGDRYGHQALPPIHIIVSNGNVRLEGVVANQVDKNLINVRANSVPTAFPTCSTFKIIFRLQVANMASALRSKWNGLPPAMNGVKRKPLANGYEEVLYSLQQEL